MYITGDTEIIYRYPEFAGNGTVNGIVSGVVNDVISGVIKILKTHIRKNRYFRAYSISNHCRTQTATDYRKKRFK